MIIILFKYSNTYLVQSAMAEEYISCISAEE